MTLRSDLVSWTTPQIPSGFDIGTIVEDATIARVDPDVGVLIDLPGALEGAYCHVRVLTY